MDCRLATAVLFNFVLLVGMLRLSTYTQSKSIGKTYFPKIDIFIGF